MNYQYLLSQILENGAERVEAEHRLLATTLNIDGLIELCDSLLHLENVHQQCLVCLLIKNALQTRYNALLASTTDARTGRALFDRLVRLSFSSTDLLLLRPLSHALSHFVNIYWSELYAHTLEQMRCAKSVDEQRRALFLLRRATKSLARNHRTRQSMYMQVAIDILYNTWSMTSNLIDELRQRTLNILQRRQLFEAMTKFDISNSSNVSFFWHPMETTTTMTTLLQQPLTSIFSINDLQLWIEVCRLSRACVLGVSSNASLDKSFFLHRVYDFILLWLVLLDYDHSNEADDDDDDDDDEHIVLLRKLIHCHAKLLCSHTFVEDHAVCASESTLNTLLGVTPQLLSLTTNTSIDRTRSLLLGLLRHVQMCPTCRNDLHRPTTRTVDDLYQLSSLIVGRLLALSSRELRQWTSKIDAEEAETLYDEVMERDYDQTPRAIAESLLLAVLAAPLLENRGEDEQRLRRAVASLLSTQLEEATKVDDFASRDAILTALGWSSFALEDFIAVDTQLLPLLTTELNVGDGDDDDDDNLMHHGVARRRRALWLLGKWATAIARKAASKDESFVYAQSFHLLMPRLSSLESDLVTRLAAAAALASLVSDVGFSSGKGEQAFAPYIAPAIESLMELIVNARIPSTRVSLLHTLSGLVVAIGGNIAPYIEPVLELISHLWLLSENVTNEATASMASVVESETDGSVLIRAGCLSVLTALMAVRVDDSRRSSLLVISLPLVIRMCASVFQSGASNDDTNEVAFFLMDDAIALLSLSLSSVIENKAVNKNTVALDQFISLIPLLIASARASPEHLMGACEVLQSTMELKTASVTSQAAPVVLEFIATLLGDVRTDVCDALVGVGHVTLLRMALVGEAAAAATAAVEFARHIFRQLLAPTNANDVALLRSCALLLSRCLLHFESLRHESELLTRLVDALFDAVALVDAIGALRDRKLVALALAIAIMPNLLNQVNGGLATAIVSFITSVDAEIAAQVWDEFDATDDDDDDDCHKNNNNNNNNDDDEWCLAAHDPVNQIKSTRQALLNSIGLQRFHNLHVDEHVKQRFLQNK